MRDLRDLQDFKIVRSSKHGINTRVKARFWPLLEVFSGQEGADLDFQLKNKYFAEKQSGSEAGSYLRLTDLCITQP